MGPVWQQQMPDLVRQSSTQDLRDVDAMLARAPIDTIVEDKGPPAPFRGALRDPQCDYRLDLQRPCRLLVCDRHDERSGQLPHVLSPGEMHANSLEDATGSILRRLKDRGIDTDAVGHPYRGREGSIRCGCGLRHVMGREPHQYDGSGANDSHSIPPSGPVDSGGGRCGNRPQELSSEPAGLRGADHADSRGLATRRRWFSLAFLRYARASATGGPV